MKNLTLWPQPRRTRPPRPRKGCEVKHCGRAHHIGKGYTSPNPLSWQYHATKGWRKVAEFSRHAMSPHRIEPHQQEKRDPVLNKYRPHYAGKRGIASERNRRKIASGQIPRSQVLRGRKAA